MSLWASLFAYSQQAKVSDMIKDAIRKELQYQFDNGSIVDTTYILLDLWNVDVADYLDVRPPRGTIVWMSMGNIDYAVLNNRIPYWHVSINIENTDIIVYIQSGMGVRYDGVCKRYEYPMRPSGSDGAPYNFWREIFEKYLSCHEGMSYYSRELPIVFGKYKYCYQIGQTGIPSHINDVTINVLSEFIKQDGSYYYDFEEEFVDIPFVVIDISYNKKNNLLIYFRNVVLYEENRIIEDGIYAHVSQSEFELSFDEMHGFQIVSCSLGQKISLDKRD